MSVRVRFSPAPSGPLHVGGARTALFNWLAARSDGGSFVIRIDDMDRTRIVEGAEESILEDLAWLGLHWSEGPDVGGPFGPYRQSERNNMHTHAFERLLSSGDVYPCFCEPAQLEMDRAEDIAAGRPPRYRSRCREISAEEGQSRIERGETPAWRLAVNGGRQIVVADEVRGDVTFASSDIGDFVVRRANGLPTYDLASVADDVAMAIDLVLRDDDHLPNTPRHILLFEALGEPVPRFAHVPLVHAADNSPLSASSGVPVLSDLREHGFLPGAVIEYISTLGWSPSERSRGMGLDSLAEEFDLHSLSTSASKHDMKRLNTIQARRLRQLDHLQRKAWLEGVWSEAPEWLDIDAFALVATDDLSTYDDARMLVERLADPLPDPQAAAVLVAEGAETALRAALGALQLARGLGEGGAPDLRDAFGSSGVSTRNGMMVVRAALSGVIHGLPVSDIIMLLGNERSIDRLSRALSSAMM